MEEKLSWCQTRIKAISHKAFGSWELKRGRKKKEKSNKNKFRVHSKPHSHQKMLHLQLEIPGHCTLLKWRALLPFPKREIIWHNPSFPETRRVRSQLGPVLVPAAVKWLRRGNQSLGCHPWSRRAAKDLRGHSLTAAAGPFPGK